MGTVLLVMEVVNSIVASAPTLIAAAAQIKAFFEDVDNAGNNPGGFTAEDRARWRKLRDDNNAKINNPNTTQL